MRATHPLILLPLVALCSAFSPLVRCSKNETQFSAPFVEFMGKKLPTNKPQTAAQALLGQQQGRAPGPKELLQPTLDSALKSYVPLKTNLTGNYTFAASDVLAVLSQSWTTAFMKYYPSVNMTIPPPYAGSLGALELINGTLEGVFVSRELKPSDVTGFTDAFGYPPLSVPMSGGSYRQYGFLDSIAFVVNKANPIESLSFDQLDSILSTTRARGGKSITKWGQLGVKGALAEKDIKIYGIQPWNGFEEFVRQKVLSYKGVRGQWRSGNVTNNKDLFVTWDATIFNMSLHVANDPAGLAYTGLAYIDSPCKVVALSNHTGNATIAPTYENVATGAWPLSRVTYFNTNTKPSAPIDPVLGELQKFILSKEGQQLVLDQGLFLPLRSYQVNSSLSLLH